MLADDDGGLLEDESDRARSAISTIFELGYSMC